eukprot:gnl/TRDRNA2_/TRDRNA2_174963_c0_seq1.p1 gnl/TRDRNA2_/TRDRNA2_174963_c0~~gnl/TRDRNA2_/TRDRNA2_174963_c0_seq1.p1  ORF type:complete len:306 (-),score=27.79 gnl/TRDRNA2_/TRDRNA2_174963_c0_seq1:310-1116(-)
MVIMGKPPIASARGDHALLPKRDRDLEAPHQRAPPVPRAPRAKPRANSCGALARMQSGSNSGGSTPTKASESRRPRDESPFSRLSHGRVSHLERENNALENQVICVGPPRRPPSAGRENYSRAHTLNQEIQMNGGTRIPLHAPPQIPDQEEPKQPARRNTLHNERRSADQALEWVPSSAAKIPAGDDAYHGRRQVLQREVNDQAASSHAPRAGLGTHHGRINTYAREQADAGELEVGRLGGFGAQSAVPNHPRKNLMTQMNPCMISAH